MSRLSPGSPTPPWIATRSPLPAAVMPVDAVVGHIQLAADEPAGEWRPLQSRTSSKSVAQSDDRPARPRTRACRPRPDRRVRRPHWPARRTPPTAGSSLDGVGGSGSHLLGPFSVKSTGSATGKPWGMGRVQIEGSLSCPGCARRDATFMRDVRVTLEAALQASPVRFAPGRHDAPNGAGCSSLVR